MDVLDLQQIDRTQIAAVGGKGAHLGELRRIEGVRVPAGFCVTTAAFRRFLAEARSSARIDRLAHVGLDDREGIRTICAEIRDVLERTPVPEGLAAAIVGALARLGEPAGCAVRSSATSEDSPTASFAGQGDTFLNVVGPAAILEHVRRCWASLFSERAVTYRLRSGADPRGARMAVVVQRMVPAEAAGVLFTADPVSGNRRVTSVEAVFGLGGALVSGSVNADVTQVRDGEVVSRAIATKPHAVRLAPDGGTQERAIAPERRDSPALTDAQAVRLAALGRRIEAHFGCPQDIEWCLVDDGFVIVQSRPITTLFPVPAAHDAENRVYVSVGHQQMMTDPMKPLGISLFQQMAGRPMVEAGGRLFVDVTAALASPAIRAGLVAGLGASDPLIGDALQRIVDRGDFVRTLPDTAPGGSPAAGPPPQAPLETDPALVTELIEQSRASVAAAREGIRGRTGAALLDFIAEDITELKRLLFEPQSHRVILAAIEASRWLDEKLQMWLGEKNAADALTQSVDHNVTSEMGLALLDVADAVRPHPEVVAYLKAARDDGFLDGLAALSGGPEARDAFRAFLDRYGMRCVGEIDLTRPRWCERPTALVPLILGHVERFEPGAGRRRFAQGLQQARSREQDVLDRLRALPGGARLAEETQQNIDRVRAFIGYREYPKYGMVSRTFVFRQALWEEAERLVQAGVLRDADDIGWLTFQELQEVVRTQRVDEGLLRRRKEAFAAHHALTPPRVITSEGEVVAGRYLRGDLPAGALVGLGVSAGTVEGRARVVLDLADADVGPGDILVTVFTDPSWTPLFVGIAGLVTEVGGRMTHGAVIAREYGLPAIVGVEQATRRIRDGQRIRVHGADGFVELLS